jgi:hypothetical protein
MKAAALAALATARMAWHGKKKKHHGARQAHGNGPRRETAAAAKTSAKKAKTRKARIRLAAVVTIRLKANGVAKWPLIFPLQCGTKAVAKKVFQYRIHRRSEAYNGSAVYGNIEMAAIAIRPPVMAGWRVGSQPSAC